MFLLFFELTPKDDQELWMITVDSKGNQVEVYKYAFQRVKHFKISCILPISGSHLLAEFRKKSEFYLFVRNAKVINYN